MSEEWARSHLLNIDNIVIVLAKKSADCSCSCQHVCLSFRSQLGIILALVALSPGTSLPLKRGGSPATFIDRISKEPDVAWVDTPTAKAAAAKPAEAKVLCIVRTEAGDVFRQRCSRHSLGVVEAGRAGYSGRRDSLTTI